MATGFIALDDTADPAIETLADTECDRCLIALGRGPYATRLRPDWRVIREPRPLSIRYLHPQCAALDDDDEDDDEACGGL